MFDLASGHSYKFKTETHSAAMMWYKYLQQATKSKKEREPVRRTTEKVSCSVNFDLLTFAAFCSKQYRGAWTPMLTRNMEYCYTIKQRIIKVIVKASSHIVYRNLVTVPKCFQALLLSHFNTIFYYYFLYSPGDEPHSVRGKRRPIKWLGDSVKLESFARETFKFAVERLILGAMFTFPAQYTLLLHKGHFDKLCGYEDPGMGLYIVGGITRLMIKLIVVAVYWEKLRWAVVKFRPFYSFKQHN